MLRATVEDPLWRMPLWDPYDDMLKSDIADMANAANSPMAGCIVAAMFLKRFVPERHQPGRTSTHMPGAIPPNRGVQRAAKRSDLRAIFELLKRRYLQR